VDYRWDFGKAAFPQHSTDAMPEVVFLQPGAQRVRLTTGNAAGALSRVQTFTYSVEQAKGPPVFFDVPFPLRAGPSGSTFTPRAFASEVTGLRWDFGGGASPNGCTWSDPVTWGAPGSYVGTVIASNSRGSVSVELPYSIDPVRPPPPSWTHSNLGHASDFRVAELPGQVAAAYRRYDNVHYAELTLPVPGTPVDWTPHWVGRTWVDLQLETIHGEPVLAGTQSENAGLPVPQFAAAAHAHPRAREDWVAYDLAGGGQHAVDLAVWDGRPAVLTLRLNPDLRASRYDLLWGHTAKPAPAEWALATGIIESSGWTLVSGGSPAIGSSQQLLPVAITDGTGIEVGPALLETEHLNPEASYTGDRLFVISSERLRLHHAAVQGSAVGPWSRSDVEPFRKHPYTPSVGPHLCVNNGRPAVAFSRMAYSSSYSFTVTHLVSQAMVPNPTGPQDWQTVEFKQGGFTDLVAVDGRLVLVYTRPPEELFHDQQVWIAIADGPWGE